MGRKTNKARRQQSAVTAREKAALARAEQQRADQRRKALIVLSSVVVIALVVAAVGYVVIHGNKSTSKNDRSTAGVSGVLNTLTSITPATLSTVGAGSTGLSAKPTSGDPPLTSHGKPELLYVGGEFCPFCAAERWSMIQALSRFGTFSGLSEIRSANDDGDLATFTFYKSHYTSKYLSFVPVENEDRAQNQLQPLTAAQNKVFSKYTTGFPFLDFGGKYVQTNAGYTETDLSGLNQQQVAAQLKNPSSKLAKDILGEANRLTATLCRLTKNQPASACLVPAISSLQSQLNA
ncbi:MAG TPA: DUF929 family protein [Mycobacteriales bacterium]|nr:DUF929 family protein [Mycobacteriales bacterium]